MAEGKRKYTRKPQSESRLLRRKLPTTPEGIRSELRKLRVRSLLDMGNRKDIEKRRSAVLAKANELGIDGDKLQLDSLKLSFRFQDWVSLGRFTRRKPKGSK